MRHSQHRGAGHGALQPRTGCPSFWGLLCSFNQLPSSFDQLSSLHITTSACSSPQRPCPPSATRVLHLHIDTSTSGGPAWLLPRLPAAPDGGRHQQDTSGAQHPACLWVLQGKALVLALSAVHHAAAAALPTAGSPQPLLTGGQHPARPRTAAHSRAGPGLQEHPHQPTPRGAVCQPASAGTTRSSGALVPGLWEWMVADPCSCPRPVSV